MVLGFALVGSGLFASSDILPAILGDSSVVLKAVYSRSEKTATGFVKAHNLDPHEINTYAEDSERKLEDLLDRSDISAVWIALPISIQPIFVRKFLAAGKHVLSEKPIAPDLQTAKVLTEYHSGLNNGSIWGVAENFRFIQAARDAILFRPALGRVHGFNTTFTNWTDSDSKWYQTAWRKDPQYQGGFILDMCVHNFAFLRQMLGTDNPIVQITAMSNQNQAHLPPIDTINAAIRLENGVNGSLHVSFSSRRTVTETSITYENGYIEMMGGFSHIRVVDHANEILYEKDYSEVAGKGPCHEELAAFVRSIESREIESMLDPREAYTDLHCVEQMLRSGEQDGKPREVRMFSA